MFSLPSNFQLDKNQLTREVLTAWDHTFLLTCSKKDEVLGAVFTTILFEKIVEELKSTLEELCYACQMDDLSQIKHDCINTFTCTELFSDALDSHLPNIVNKIDWNEFKGECFSRTVICGPMYESPFSTSHWRTRGRLNLLKSMMLSMFEFLSYANSDLGLVSKRPFDLMDVSSIYYCIMDYIFWILQNPFKANKQFARTLTG